MRDPVRRIFLLAFIQLVMLAGCGGGTSDLSASSSSSSSSSPTGSNVVSMTVDTGPTGGTGNFNVPYVNVTLCAPGSTTNCQTIDHVEVDTASYGVRIISSVLNSTLLNALTQETASNTPLVECTVFGDGYSWGSMRIADVEIGGEKAASQPVQVIGDQDSLNNVPSVCSSTGPQEDTVAEFGANGIIGVGPFVQDCGSVCVDTNTYAQYGFYWTCPANATGSNACQQTPVALNQQAANPVYSFTTDNNGVILELPSIADSGAINPTGSLVFGIGTQSNNGLGSATVLTTNDSGFISVAFNGSTFSEGFIDSGSNLFFFTDTNNGTPTGVSNIATCTIDNQSFFCPSSELSLSATNEGQNNVTSIVSFNVANANTQFSNDNGNYTAFDNVAAPNATADEFDFGLPFFYGRNVYTAIAGMNTPGGQGPYFAY